MLVPQRQRALRVWSRAARFMRRGGSGTRAPADTEPLDEGEQAALVAELERSAAAQARLWRVRRLARRAALSSPRACCARRPLTPSRCAQRCFGGVGAALAALFAYASLWQLVHPWQSVFHADYSGALGHRAVAAADAAAAACIGGAAHALLRAARQPEEQRAALRQLAAAGALALCTSAFWAVAWRRHAALRARRCCVSPVAAPDSCAASPHAGCIAHAALAAQTTRSSCCGCRSRRSTRSCARTWSAASTTRSERRGAARAAHNLRRLCAF